MNWTFKDVGIESLNSFPPDTFGFIYMLIYESGKAYIGKKNLYSTQTLPALKNGSQRPNSTRKAKNKNGKRVYFDIVQKESNWRTYESSSEFIPSTDKLVEKHILDIAFSQRELTYLETKYLFQYEVLESDNYYNRNILNKFFK